MFPHPTKEQEMSKFTVYNAHNPKVEAALEALDVSAALYSSKLEDTLGREPGYERDRMIDERAAHLTLGYLKATVKRLLIQIEDTNPELVAFELGVINNGFKHSIANLEAEKEAA